LLPLSSESWLAIVGRASPSEPHNVAGLDEDLPSGSVQSSGAAKPWLLAEVTRVITEAPG
jgi:hypothetical protein